MSIKRLFIATAMSLVTATAAAADIISLSSLSQYLNNLHNARGSFTQINADGTISTGTIYIKRPGRIRFEYDPPEEALVLASGGTVAIFDGKSNTGPEQYPLNRTPLSLILARNVNLERANMVVGHREEGATTIVTAQDPEEPQYGNIQLVFTGAPVELRQWIVTDEGGNQTTVVLGDLDTRAQNSNGLFSIRQEASNRGFGITD